jgi:hypothetical protein
MIQLDLLVIDAMLLVPQTGILEVYATRKPINTETRFKTSLSLHTHFPTQRPGERVSGICLPSNIRKLKQQFVMSENKS